MRHIFLTSVVFLTGLCLRAAEQLIPVTPQTLQSWTLIGATKSTLAEQAILKLPAAAQLSREFSGQAVIMHLVTSPNFSEVSTDWPIVEVGPAAAALLRKDGHNQLVLVVDEHVSMELSLADESTSVDLALAYDPITGVGLIRFQGEVRSFEITPTKKTVEIVLSAGGKDEWPLSLAEVLLLSSDSEEGAASKWGRNTSTNSIRSAINGLTDGGTLERASGGGAGNGPGVSTGNANKTAASSGQYRGLQIFTPSSTRHGRAEAVRAIVARTQGK